MAGRIEAYFIKHTADVEYLVRETERILLESNGHKRVKASMNVHVQDEETAKNYREKILENERLSLIDLAEPRENKIYSGKSFLVSLVQSSKTGLRRHGTGTGGVA